MSSEALDGGAVREVERITREAAKAEIHEIGGRKFSTKALHDPIKPQPVPATLELSTLTSLAEYVKAKQDGGYLGTRQAFLHVESPTSVRLCTGIFGEHNQRADVVRAKAIVPDLEFGEWTEHEEFVIQLMTHFEDGEVRRKVQAIVGNLQTEAVQTSKDDGTTQTVELKAGLMRREGEVPNPVVLRPWRTFPEIVPPESPFVLRLRGGGGGQTPTCALFEADGGRWQILAIESTKTFLRQALGADFPIYG